MITFQQQDKQVLSKMEYDSHYYRVYIYLRDVGTLTTQESISIWNRYNLAQVVARLKKLGANIVDDNVMFIQNGGRYKAKRLKPWAKYRLLQEDVEGESDDADE